jgi:carboxymethylenebutenolidase
MCFDDDSRPPIPPMAGGAVDGQRIELRADDGNRFAAYRADALAASAAGGAASRAGDAASRAGGAASSAGGAASGAGIIVLPDVRGLHRFYEELALRFAEAGIDALAIDYFGRTAGIGTRDASFDHMPHVGRTTFTGLASDVRAAAAHLRSESGVRAVFTVGFCFGGRLAFLTGTLDGLEPSGVIGFYGVPVGPARNDMPPPVDMADRIVCPVLGLFGGADQGIPPEALERFDAALDEAGIDHELVTYPGAPHSFFDRKADEHADESADAWRRVLEFIRGHTPAR